MIYPRGITIDLEIAPQVATDSPVRRLAIREDCVLIRPYSPAGKTKGGLWLERNPKHPKIWAWVLAVPRVLRERIPHLVPGEMVVVSRWDGDTIEKEQPLRSRYIGQHHRVVAIPVEAVHATIVPALVKMENCASK